MPSSTSSDGEEQPLQDTLFIKVSGQIDPNQPDVLTGSEVSGTLAAGQTVKKMASASSQVEKDAVKERYDSFNSPPPFSPEEVQRPVKIILLAILIAVLSLQATLAAEPDIKGSKDIPYSAECRIFT